MPAGGAMVEPGPISLNMRQLYNLVYEWYQYDDLKSVSRLAESNRIWNREDDNIRAYIDAVRQMPVPGQARPEQIFDVAVQIRRGILEFTCGEQVNDQYNLYELAEILMTLYQQLQEERAQQQLRASIHDTTIPSAEEYFQRAALFYDKELEDDIRNLGSRAALADTNWEMQQLSPATGMKYRDAAELHFREINDPNNLYMLTIKERLSIDSIQIKS